MPKDFSKASHLSGFYSKIYLVVCGVAEFKCLKHLDALLSFTFIVVNIFYMKKIFNLGCKYEVLVFNFFFNVSSL